MKEVAPRLIVPTVVMKCSGNEMKLIDWLFLQITIENLES